MVRPACMQKRRSVELEEKKGLELSCFAPGRGAHVCYAALGVGRPWPAICGALDAAAENTMNARAFSRRYGPRNSNKTLEVALLRHAVSSGSGSRAGLNRSATPLPRHTSLLAQGEPK